MSGYIVRKVNMVNITIPYSPRPQQIAVHNSSARFKVVVAHRRMGKSVLAINELIKNILTHPLKNPQGAFISPDQRQSRRNAWSYLKEFLGPVPGVSYNEAELRADLPNGGKIYLMGAENYHSLRGMYFDAIVMDEVGNIPANFFSEIIRPALADRKGKALFIGTAMRGSTLHDLYKMASRDDTKDWEAFLFRASETGVIDPDELEALKLEMPPEIYAQEFESSFEVTNPASYYGASLAKLRTNGQIGDFPYDPYLPVITSFDLGVTDKTAIWFAQVREGRVTIIDYFEEHFADIAEYVPVLNSKPYLYDYHILPHDVHQARGTGATRYDILKRAGLNVKVAPKYSVDDGIAAVHRLLPRCYFNEQAVDKGLEALRLYSAVINKNTGESTGVPDHKWSDAADAFRYLAVMLKPALLGDKPKEPFFDPRKNRWINPLQERVDDYDPFKY